VVDFSNSGATTVVADPAYSGHVYSMATTNVVNWIARRGYSA
jgi:hypothetical protein